MSASGRWKFEEPDIGLLKRALLILHSSPAEGIPLLEKLAENHSRSAMIHLGHAYQSGILGGPDIDRAEIWYQRAARLEFIPGYYYLGWLYLKEKRYSEAMSALSLAANKGYPPALQLLGKIYFNGWGVTKDAAQSEIYLTRAVSAGNVPARDMLGSLLLRDVGHPARQLRGLILRLSYLLYFVWVRALEGKNSQRLH